MLASRRIIFLVLIHCLQIADSGGGLNHEVCVRPDADHESSIGNLRFGRPQSLLGRTVELLAEFLIVGSLLKLLTVGLVIGGLLLRHFGLLAVVRGVRNALLDNFEVALLPSDVSQKVVDVMLTFVDVHLGIVNNPHNLVEVHVTLVEVQLSFADVDLSLTNVQLSIEEDKAPLIDGELSLLDGESLFCQSEPRFLLDNSVG